MDDLISRRAAIDALNEYFARIGKLKRRGLNKGEKAISLDTVGVIDTLPSAPISYLYCANAMLMMWLDEVITDGEYNRIMDKLNALELKRRSNNG